MGKVMTSLMWVEELCRCRDGGCGCSQQPVPAPGAKLQLLEEMQLFLMLPPRFSLVPGACSYLDWLLSPAWLRSTLSRALRTFLRFTTPAISSQPSLAPSALRWDFEGFAVLFFPKLNDWNFFFDVYFKSILSKRFFCCYRVRNNLKASLLNSVAAYGFRSETGTELKSTGRDLFGLKIWW